MRVCDESIWLVLISLCSGGEQLRCILYTPRNEHEVLKFPVISSLWPIFDQNAQPTGNRTVFSMQSSRSCQLASHNTLYLAAAAPAAEHSFIHWKQIVVGRRSLLIEVISMMMMCTRRFEYNEQFLRSSIARFVRAYCLWAGDRLSRFPFCLDSLRRSIREYGILLHNGNYQHYFLYISFTRGIVHSTHVKGQNNLLLEEYEPFSY